MLQNSHNQHNDCRGPADARTQIIRMSVEGSEQSLMKFLKAHELFEKKINIVEPMYHLIVEILSKWQR